MSRTALLVGILTVLVHLQGVVVGDGRGEFVYDDRRFIELNPAVKTIQAPWVYLDPRTAAVDGWGGIYRPLRTFSFAIDWAVLGDRPRLWRLESVLLHGLAAALLAALLVRLTGVTWASTLGALLFGFHPLTAEVSSWVSSRGDVLAMVGALAAAHLHLRRRWIAAALVFLLALAGKSMVVTLPVLLLLVEAARGDRPLRDRTSIRAYAALVVVAVGFVAVRWLALRDAFAQSALDHWMARRAAGFLYDAWATLFPVVLGFDWQVTGTWLTALLATGLVLAMLGAAILLWERGSRMAGAGLAWFLVALVPVSLPFFPLKIATADRFLYVSLAGSALFATALLARVGHRARPAVVAAAVTLVVLLGSLTLMRTPVYASERALWTEAKRASDKNPRAVDGLGWAALRAGDLATARVALEAYVERVPEDPKGHMNLAQVYHGIARRGGDGAATLLGRALAEYREAIQIWETGAAPGSDVLHPQACMLSARLAMAVGDLPRAEADVRSALALGVPEAQTVLQDVVLIYLELGELDAAVRAAGAMSDALGGRGARRIVRDLRARHERNRRVQRQVQGRDPEGAATSAEMNERFNALEARLP